MRSQEKAEQLYQNSLKLHGKEKAKKEALNSAHATKALAPIMQRDYWERVINHLISR